MARIFISYKRVDKEKVFALIDKIETDTGEKCWVDIEGIESDAQFKNVIIRAIKQCEVVLFMYSKAHSTIVDFERDWTVRELNFASAKNKRIVFINLDRTPLTDEFSFDYGTKQQIDGQSTEAVNRLISDLKKWLMPLKSDTNILYPETFSSSVIRDNRCNSKGQTTSSSKTETLSDKIRPLPNNETEQISIHDTKTPIAVLIGPPAIGKTMTLVRLFRFLSEHHYIIEPDPFFRSMHDERYQKTCEYFRNQIFSTFASSGTANRDSILIKVLNKSGMPLLQVIDLPGEFFFNSILGHKDFNHQISTIFSTFNPHIWIIFIELGWGNIDIRQRYVSAIKKYSNYFAKRDKVIILCNKIDKLPYYYKSNIDSIDMESLESSIKGEYPGLLSIFDNKNPITQLFHKYNCTILPFSSGNFSQSGTNTIYVPSVQDFPLRLKKELYL